MKDDQNLTKLIDLIDKILNYCKGLDYQDFIKNDMLVEACVFNLTQLGETSHKISAETVKLHPEIPWRELYGLRNRLVHDYQGVNLLLVWEIIHDDLANLRAQLASIM